MTTKRPWMPLYIADYRQDTLHLSTTEHGAYMLLIMEYWHSGRLPTDDEALAQIVKLSPYLWKKISPTILKFFDENFRHKRIETELRKANARILKNQQRAQKAAAARWSSKHSSSNAPSNAQSYAWPMHTSHKKDKPYFGTTSEQPTQMLQASPQGTGGSLATAPDGGALAAPPSVVPHPKKPLPVSDSLLRIELAKQLRRPVSDQEFERYLETRAQP